MRVEIVEEAGGENPAQAFPPEEDFPDLCQDPQAVDRVPAARQFPPLRNFLTAINGAESAFSTLRAATKSDSPAAVSGGLAYEFAVEASLAFAEPALNFDRKNYEELSSSLKGLLERNPADAVRAVLRISGCEFPGQERSGFCLAVRLVAGGDSAQQAELHCGLALARVQQALLFRARALKQHIRA